MPNFDEIAQSTAEI